MPGPFSCRWGCVYIMFPTSWQLFRTIWEYFPILSTGTNGAPMAPKVELYLLHLIHARTVFIHVGICLYHVPNNVATVSDHLAVFSDSVHRSRRQLTCA